MEDVLKGFEWNQVGGNASSLFNGALLQILAFDPKGNPKLIGTAFIIGTDKKKGVAVTAAHNFYKGVKNVQRPYQRHHSSTPQEFLPENEEIQVDPKKLKAIFPHGDQSDLCDIDYVVWEKSTDFAYFAFSPNNPSKTDSFIKEMAIQEVNPCVGDLVGLLGFRNMATTPLLSENGIAQFEAKSELICRAGKITEVHAEGYLLCRGHCLKTSIPVFGGMSGGPVFLIPEAGEPMVPFGIISFDPEAPDEEKNNREIAGNSIISLLNPNFPEGKKNQITFDLLEATRVAKKTP